MTKKNFGGKVVTLLSVLFYKDFILPESNQHKFIERLAQKTPYLLHEYNSCIVSLARIKTYPPKLAKYPFVKDEWVNNLLTLAWHLINTKKNNRHYFTQKRLSGDLVKPNRRYSV